jgi:hypothetical protein
MTATLETVLDQLAEIRARLAIIESQMRRPQAAATVPDGSEEISSGRAAVFAAWRQSDLIGRAFTTGELIEEAGRLSPLCQALLLVAESFEAPGRLDAKALGQWLARQTDEPDGGFRLSCDRRNRRRPRWRLVAS